MIRVVVDTNVVLSGLLWSGRARLILDAARVDRIWLATSLALLAELTDILGRRKFDRERLASGRTVDELVSRYALLASVVRPERVPRIAPDPDDDVVIGTALAARASLIVTGDKPLLTVSVYRGVRIVGVGEALELCTGG